ncbi:MAG: hypothetical protein ACT4NL_17465 [Pseudomarimonas sp.]
MKRLLSVFALTTLLAGCVSYTEYGGYDDGYYTVGRDANGNPVYVDGSSYYSPSGGGSGDYYYHDDGYADYGYSSYVDSPYYYSLFWSLNRWSVDPYWHPQFFYGVTYYPRNYFGFGYYGGFNQGYGYGYGSRYRPFGYSSYAYSPYRLSWVDGYYDWSSYHHHYTPSYSHYAPRYGNARNEAAWLSRQSNYNAGNGYNTSNYGGRSGGLPRTQASRYEDRSQRAVIERRQAQRGADYGTGSGSGRRADPAVSGFGYDRDAASKRPVRVDSSRERHIGDSGDVRNGEVGARQPSRYSGAREQLPARSQRYGSSIERGYAPRAREDDAGGYRIAPSRSSTYGQPVQQSPRRAAPVYRESSPRFDSGAEYQPRQSRSAPVYQQPQPREQSAPRYRSAESGRESYSPRESRFSQPSYGEQRSSQPSYREPAPRQYEAPARMESRGGDYGRSEARSEPRFESRSEPTESPRSRETDEQAPP